MLNDLYTIYKNGIIMDYTRHEVYANLVYIYYDLRYNKDIVTLETIHNVDDMYPGLKGEIGKY